MVNNTTVTTGPLFNETFGLAFCQLVDFPENGSDCSRSDPFTCVKCGVEGKFFTGESINNYGSYALKYYYVFWVVIIFVSTLAVFSNILILVVMKQRKTNRSFDILLYVLAGFDAFSSFMAVVGSTGSVAYFGNWFGRGKVSMYWYLVSLFTTIFGRTGSTYMTVLITIERFLMITFSASVSPWFTPRNTRIMASVVLCLAVMINYPRFVGYSLEENNFRDIPSIEALEYVFRPTSQFRFWYGTLGGIHNQMDYWLPLPIILVFNFMSFLKVHQLSKQRKQLNLSVKRDIRATKMFLPVVVVYFLTNIGPILNYVFIKFTKTVYRELVQVLYLSIAVNSAVNLPIYYLSSASFRADVKILTGGFFGKLGLREMKTERDQEMGLRCHQRESILGVWRSDSGLPTSPTS